MSNLKTIQYNPLHAFCMYISFYVCMREKYAKLMKNWAYVQNIGYTLVSFIRFFFFLLNFDIPVIRSSLKEPLGEVVIFFFPLFFKVHWTLIMKLFGLFLGQ